MKKILMATGVAIVCAAMALAVLKPRTLKPPTASSVAAAYQWESAPRAVLASHDSVGTRDAALTVSLAGDISMLVVSRDQKQSQLCLYHSHDGGDAFSHRVAVSAPGAKVNSHGENQPSLAQAARGPVALWQQDDARGTGIYIARSTSWGHSFQAPQRISDVGARSYFGHIAAHENGKNLVAVWLDGRDPKNDGTASVYGATSTDGGATWHRNFRVARGVCPCCRPQAVFTSRGEICVMWRNVFENQMRDMASARSADGGKTWSAARRVAADGWQIFGCPDSGPQLARAGNVLWAAWYSAGKNSDAGIRLSQSSDGQTWSAPRIVSQPLLDASQPALCATEKGRVFVSFRARDAKNNNGWDSLQPYVVAVDGESVGAPLLVSAGKSSVAQPALCADDANRLWLAWNGENGVQLLRGRAAH